MASPTRRPSAFRPRVERLEDRETPATFTVQNGLDSGAGSLRNAVAQANSNPGADTIIFGVGVGDVVLTTDQLTLTDTTGATTIRGPSGGTHVVQRSFSGGTPNFRIFSVITGASAVFNNLTISNGNTGGVGGGVINEGTLTFTNSTVSGNNSSIYGGGIENSTTGTLTVTNSTISGNTSYLGGGIDNDGTLTVTSSTVSGNSSSSSAGGIWSGGTLTVTNSTVSGNTSNGSGGGIYTSGTTTLTNVTITGNRSDNDNSGSGTAGGLSVGSGTPLLRNTIIAGNFRRTDTTRDDVSGAVAGTSVNNLIGDGTGLTGINNGFGGNQIGSGVVPIDPLLGLLAYNGGPTQLHPLLAGSLAINAGSNTAASSLTLTSDGRSGPFVRISGGNVDIGAFEVQATPVSLAVSKSGDADDGLFGPGQLTLREAVRVAHNPGADTITFAAGLGDVVLTTAHLTLSDTTGATTINGPSGATQVVRRSSASGTPDFRIFSVNSFVTANFNNLTISNGRGNDGGGISNFGNVTITNSTVSGNTASVFGGGIENDGTLTLANSTLSSNRASAAGGVFNRSAGTLTLTNSTVSGNTTTYDNAGGIANDGTLTVTNSTVSGNSANNRGGGISAVGTVTVTNSTITGNRSDNNNNGTRVGGGLYRAGGTVTLNNTIIAGNFRGTGTTRDDVSGAVAGTSVNNLVGDGTGLTGITNGTGGNLIGTGAAPINPLLLPLGDNGGPTKTHALGQNSPALGKASASVANYSVYDQRGTARDLGAPDIGAYEVQHPLAPVGVPTTNATLFAPKPSATANEAFVKGLYQSTLLRAPDAGGMANWLNHLANGMTRDTVANGFVNSTENRRNQVTFFYRYFLSREPDAGGLTHWVAYLQSGNDEGTTMIGFVLSPEFSANNTNTQFVNLMYYALLGREADSGGFNTWMTNLSNGMSRATVVQSFLRSDESLNRVIRSLFQAYLKREADAGGLSTFRTQLLNGTTFGQVATSILGGQEFFNNATANMT